MIDRQLTPEKIKLVMTEIRKNEFDLPTEIIDRFLENLYYKWLELKVTDILK